MKNKLIFISAVIFSLSVKAQLYTPNSGNVGIGIENPQTKLDVAGTGRFKVPDDESGVGGLTIETNNGTNLKMGGNTTYSWIQSHMSLPLYINELGNNTILNPRYGNVGIGTAAPSGTLDLKRLNSNLVFDLNTNNFCRIVSKGWNANIDMHTFQIDGTENVNQFHLNANGNVGIGTSEPIGILDLKKLNSNLVFDLNTNNFCRIVSKGWNANIDMHTFKIDGTENLNQFHLNTNGNVGIGTLDPTSKLDVAGQINSYNAAFGQIDTETSTKAYANFSTNNHGSVLMSSNLYISNGEDLKVANTHPSMSGGAILLPGNGRSNQGSILFYTNNSKSVLKDESFSGSISMKISGNGNVGIGETNPTNKLDVKGTIHSQEVKVDMKDWSDFVFKKEYNLPTLQEVEKHINEKGHLENIPSEGEVLKNGINLGEMNAKLLQKIEELTLYVIEQNKRLDKVEKENADLKSQINSSKK